MVKGDVNRIHGRLDDILEQLTEQVKISSAQEQHLKALNGTVVRHEKQFKDIYGKVDGNTGNIRLAQGGILVVGFIGTVLGFIILTRGLLW